TALIPVHWHDKTLGSNCRLRRRKLIPCPSPILSLCPSAAGRNAPPAPRVGPSGTIRAFIRSRTDASSLRQRFPLEVELTAIRSLRNPIDSDSLQAIGQ